jgi:hypothetical protein
MFFNFTRLCLYHEMLSLVEDFQWLVGHVIQSCTSRKE